jgi:hypothetical protein
MAGIVKTSINLSAIPKDKIIAGKKGQYLPITITINDEVDQYGNQGPVIVSQSKEEREAKEAKTYLGNAQVVWTNGEFPSPPPREGAAPNMPPTTNTGPVVPDLPF